MSGALDARVIDVGWISRVMTRLIETGKPVMALDQSSGQVVPVSPQLAAAPHGFLPLFLAVGDTVWREATGRSLGIDLQRDPQTLLGYRARSIAPGPVAPVMLSMMHAISRAERPDMLLINDLHGPWQAAQERLRWLPDRPAGASSTANTPPTPVPPPIAHNFGTMRP